jgi:hypothetical protein
MTGASLACRLCEVRSLLLCDGGAETPLEAFARDHVAICRVAGEGEGAILRLWRGAAEHVSLGRFHRRAAGASGLVRRLCGGRPIVGGPGIVGLSLFLPSLAWLSRDGGLLGPDRVLNHALRPLLAVLRGAGVDAFYGGRDLVTWADRPVAAAAFTVLPDGVAVVQAWVAASTGFERGSVLLAQRDPEGLVPRDEMVFARSEPLVRRLASVADLDWPGALIEPAAKCYSCPVTREDGAVTLRSMIDVAPAYEALQRELGPIEEGWKSASAIEMLGAVEVAARIEDGRIDRLELSGDILATFRTLEELANACRGEPPTRAAAERAMLTVTSRPGRFVLGLRDFGGLVERLA